MSDHEPPAPGEPTDIQWEAALALNLLARHLAEHLEVSREYAFQRLLEIESAVGALNLPSVSECWSEGEYWRTRYAAGS